MNALWLFGLLSVLLILAIIVATASVIKSASKTRSCEQSSKSPALDADLMTEAVARYSLHRQNKVVQWASIFILIVGATLGYWQWGAWKSLLEYEHQQVVHQQVQTVLKSLKSPQELVDKLKTHLQHEPNSARGWFLLGRLYASQEKWSAAFDAFQQAHQLDPKNEQITVNYAQSIWQTHHQTFNQSLRHLFQSILKENPNQPDALSMLAIDAFQRHAYQNAINYWTHLLSLVPSDSDESKVIRQAIAKAQAAIKAS